MCRMRTRSGARVARSPLRPTNRDGGRCTLRIRMGPRLRIVDTGMGEIGLPDWIQGQFAIQWGMNDRYVYAVRRYRSRSELLRITVADRSVEVLPSDFTSLDELTVHPAEPDHAGLCSVFTHVANGARFAHRC